jgi:hypothetical protein
VTLDNLLSVSFCRNHFQELSSNKKAFQVKLIEKRRLHSRHELNERPRVYHECTFLWGMSFVPAGLFERTKSRYVTNAAVSFLILISHSLFDSQNFWPPSLHRLFLLVTSVE